MTFCPCSRGSSSITHRVVACSGFFFRTQRSDTIASDDHRINQSDFVIKANRNGLYRTYCSCEHPSNLEIVRVWGRSSPCVGCSPRQSNVAKTGFPKKRGMPSKGRFLRHLMTAREMMSSFSSMLSRTYTSTDDVPPSKLVHVWKKCTAGHELWIAIVMFDLLP